MSAHNALYELNQPAIDDFGGKILDYGITMPVDGVAGFAPGCIFIHVDGGRIIAAPTKRRRGDPDYWQHNWK